MKKQIKTVADAVLATVDAVDEINRCLDALNKVYANNQSKRRKLNYAQEKIADVAFMINDDIDRLTKRRDDLIPKE